MLRLIIACILAILSAAPAEAAIAIVGQSAPRYRQLRFIIDDMTATQWAALGRVYIETAEDGWLPAMDAADSPSPLAATASHTYTTYYPWETFSGGTPAVPAEGNYWVSSQETGWLNLDMGYPKTILTILYVARPANTYIVAGSIVAHNGDPANGKTLVTISGDAHKQATDPYYDTGDNSRVWHIGSTAKNIYRLQLTAYNDTNYCQMEEIQFKINGSFASLAMTTFGVVPLGYAATVGNLYGGTSVFAYTLDGNLDTSWYYYKAPIAGTTINAYVLLPRQLAISGAKFLTTSYAARAPKLWTWAKWNGASYDTIFTRDTDWTPSNGDSLEQTW